MRFVIPGIPPTINHVYIFRGWRKIISKEGREYQAKAMYHLGLTEKTWEIDRSAKLAVTITIRSDKWMTQPKKNKPSIPSMAVGDIDNRIKFLLDCLQKTVGFNDCQVFLLKAEKAPLMPGNEEQTEIFINEVFS